jgi:hypothetical protein
MQGRRMPLPFWFLGIDSIIQLYKNECSNKGSSNTGKCELKVGLAMIALSRFVQIIVTGIEYVRIMNVNAFLILLIRLQ